MKYVIVKKNKDGSPNKRDLKKIEHFFSEENFSKQNIDNIDNKKLFAVMETKLDINTHEHEFVGLRFTFGEECFGCDYSFGTIYYTDNVYVYYDGEYHCLKDCLKKAKELIKEYFK